MIEWMDSEMVFNFCFLRLHLSTSSDNTPIEPSKCHDIKVSSFSPYFLKIHTLSSLSV